MINPLQAARQWLDRRRQRPAAPAGDPPAAAGTVRGDSPPPAWSIYDIQDEAWLVAWSIDRPAAWTEDPNVALPLRLELDIARAILLDLQTRGMDCCLRPVADWAHEYDVTRRTARR